MGLPSQSKAALASALPEKCDQLDDLLQPVELVALLWRRTGQGRLQLARQAHDEFNVMYLALKGSQSYSLSSRHIVGTVSPARIGAVPSQEIESPLRTLGHHGWVTCSELPIEYINSCMPFGAVQRWLGAPSRPRDWLVRHSQPHGQEA